LVILAAMPAKVATKTDVANPGEHQTGMTDEERRRKLGLSRG
jgi:hypothetical protein